MTDLCIVTGNCKQPTRGRGFVFTPKYHGPQANDGKDFVVLFGGEEQSHLGWADNEMCEAYMTLSEAQEEAQKRANDSATIEAVWIVNARTCQITAVEGSSAIGASSEPLQLPKFALPDSIINFADEQLGKIDASFFNLPEGEGKPTLADWYGRKTLISTNDF